jgi:methyl-accepting chemotaxis protein
LICIYFCGALQEGDTGRGFAVVAEEIRNLAEDATEKSKQSSRVLKEIMQSMEEQSAGSSHVTEALDAEMKKCTL